MYTERPCGRLVGRKAGKRPSVEARNHIRMKEWWSVAHVLHEEGKLPVSRVCRRCGRSTVVYYKGRKTRARLANREDFILLLARRERIVNPMAACEKVLYAIRPAMAAEGVSMGVNRFYRLMKANGMMVPKRKKYSCTTTIQDKSPVPSSNLVKDSITVVHFHRQSSTKHCEGVL